MWLHDDCLTHDALLSTWKRLGAHEPHRSTSVKHETNGDEARQPLSPSETGVAASAQDTIDVKPEEKTIQLGQVDSASSSVADIKDLNINSFPVAPGAKKRGRPRKSEVRELDNEPYLGHFKAALTDESGKGPIMEITDLRHDVLGGESAWKEPVECLQCRQAIR